MKSVIVITDNKFLSKGILEILKLRNNNYVFEFASNLDEVTNISQFDYIFLEIDIYETRLCLFKMRNRKENSLLFFIQKGMSYRNKKRFLRCYEDAIIVGKNLTIDSIIQTISKYQKIKDSLTCIKINYCVGCKYPYLTDIQLLVLIGIKNGFSAKELSFALKISNKTIFTHISRIKYNFNLRGNLGLSNFLKNDLSCYEPICKKSNLR